MTSYGRAEVRDVDLAYGLCTAPPSTCLCAYKRGNTVLTKITGSLHYSAMDVEELLSFQVNSLNSLYVHCTTILINN